MGIYYQSRIALISLYQSAGDNIETEVDGDLRTDSDGTTASQAVLDSLIEEGHAESAGSHRLTITHSGIVAAEDILTDQSLSESIIGTYSQKLADLIIERRHRRYRVLNRLYALSEADGFQTAYLDTQVREGLEIDDTDWQPIADYLAGHNLIKPRHSPQMEITLNGIKEIEIFDQREVNRASQLLLDESSDSKIFSATYEGLPTEKGAINAVAMKTVPDPRTIFVVHGRNEKARRALFDFLRSIGLSPLEWSQAVEATGKGSPYIGEILDAAFERAQAIVVLMTPDDEAQLRASLRTAHEPAHELELTPQARANVLFEAGMAMGRSPERTVLVEMGKLRPFSDIGGRHTIRLDNSTARRQEFAQRLRVAGCQVDLSGVDWHEVGDFIAALANPPSETNAVAQSVTAALGGPIVSNEDVLSKEEKELLVSAADQGEIFVFSSNEAGSWIRGAGRDFYDESDRLVAANYLEALDSLCERKLAKFDEGSLYLLTGKGLRLARELRQNEKT